MTALLRIAGKASVIAGDIDSDAMLHPRHHAVAAPEELARHCLEGVPGFTAGRPILIATGRFCLGLPRPPFLAALGAAGVKLVVAPAIAPMFAEMALNSGAMLIAEAALPVLPAPDTEVACEFDGREAGIRFAGYAGAFPALLPDWALAGRSWVEELVRRAMEAGGLETVRRR